MKTILTPLALVVLLATLFPPRPVRADMAPPETPPGANPVPGAETTQVRMVAETVTLTIAQDPADPKGATARTVAAFTMRNLGRASESMPASPRTLPIQRAPSPARWPHLPCAILAAPRRACRRVSR